MMKNMLLRLCFAIIHISLVCVYGDIQTDLLLRITPVHRVFVTVGPPHDQGQVHSKIQESVLSSWKRISINELSVDICSEMAAKQVPFNVDFIWMLNRYTDIRVLEKTFLCYKPSLVYITYNPFLHPEKAVTISDSCSDRGHTLTGASALALEKMAFDFHYELSALDICNGMYFILKSEPTPVFYSRYRIFVESSSIACPQTEFYSQNVLATCMSYTNSDVIPVEAYKDLMTLSMNLTFQLTGNQNIVSFLWSKIAVPVDSNPEDIINIVDIYEDLAGSIRLFLHTHQIPRSVYSAVYAYIGKEGQRRYPTIFNGLSNLIWDMSQPFAMSSMRSGTDKFVPHGYYRFYSRYIQQYMHILQDSNLDYAMLEIGIQGGHSVNMWLDIFAQNVFVYGLDIQNAFVGNKYKVFKADQSSMENMTYIASYIHSSIAQHKIFFMVDDGSHVPEHQIKSFDYFFSELLQLGGTYIIEDIETSYWRVGYQHVGKFQYGFKHKNSAIEVFKLLADEVNTEFLTDEDLVEQNHLVGNYFSLKTRRLVSSITFAHNCVIIVKKSVEEVLVYNGREYRGRSWKLYSEPGSGATKEATRSDL